MPAIILTDEITGLQSVLTKEMYENMEHEFVKLQKRHMQLQAVVDARNEQIGLILSHPRTGIVNCYDAKDVHQLITSLEEALDARDDLEKRLSGSHRHDEALDKDCCDLVATINHLQQQLKENEAHRDALREALRHELEHDMVD